MKWTLILATFFLAITTGSCTGDNHASAAAKNSYKEPQWPPVELDNGAKWTANPETTQSISVMQDFLKTQSEKLSAAEIKDRLQNEFKLIFKNCTMTGAAHDQLHNYLLPLRDKINALNDDNRKTALSELQNYLNSYNRYFQ
jgi:hypothetical protein